MFASAAYYTLTQENVLTNDPDHLFFSVQTGEVKVQGLELEAVARIRERITLNASYTYTDSEVTKSNGPDLGKELPIVARHKASAFADYTFQDGPLAGFGAGVGVRYLGPSFGDAANTPILEGEDSLLVDVARPLRLEATGSWRSTPTTCSTTSTSSAAATSTPASTASAATSP